MLLGRVANRSGTAPPGLGEIRRELPFITKRSYFQKNSTGFFLEPSIPYPPEENVKQIFGRRGCESGSFHHSLLYSQWNELIRGGLGLGRSTALTVLALGLQLPKCSLERCPLRDQRGSGPLPRNLGQRPIASARTAVKEQSPLLAAFDRL